MSYFYSGTSAPAVGPDLQEPLVGACAHAGFKNTHTHCDELWLYCRQQTRSTTAA